MVKIHSNSITLHNNKDNKQLQARHRKHMLIKTMHEKISKGLSKC